MDVAMRLTWRAADTNYSVYGNSPRHDYRDR